MGSVVKSLKKAFSVVVFRSFVLVLLFLASSVLTTQFAQAGTYPSQGEVTGVLTLKDKKTSKNFAFDASGPVVVDIDSMKLSDGFKEMVASRFKLELQTQSGQKFRFRVPSEYFHKFSEFSVPAKVTGQNVALSSTRVEESVVTGTHTEKVACEYDGICTACSYAVNESDPLSCSSRKRCPGKKEVLVEDLEVTYHYIFRVFGETGQATLQSEKRVYPDKQTVKDLSTCEESTALFGNN